MQFANKHHEVAVSQETIHPIHRFTLSVCVVFSQSVSSRVVKAAPWTWDRSNPPERSPMYWEYWGKLLKLIKVQLVLRRVHADAEICCSKAPLSCGWGLLLSLQLSVLFYSFLPCYTSPLRVPVTHHIFILIIAFQMVSCDILYGVL